MNVNSFNHFNSSKLINLLRRKGKQNINIDIEFTLLKMIFDREARSQKRNLHAKSATEDTVSITIKVAFRHLMGPCRQSSTSLKFIMSMYHSEMFNQNN